MPLAVRKALRVPLELLVAVMVPLPVRLPVCVGVRVWVLVPLIVAVRVPVMVTLIEDEEEGVELPLLVLGPLAVPVREEDIVRDGEAVAVWVLEEDGVKLAVGLLVALHDVVGDEVAEPLPLLVACDDGESDWVEETVLLPVGDPVGVGVREALELDDAVPVADTVGLDESVELDVSVEAPLPDWVDEKLAAMDCEGVGAPLPDIEEVEVLLPDVVDVPVIEGVKLELGVAEAD